MWRSLHQRRDHIRFVIGGAKSSRSIGRKLGEVAPASFVTELAVQAFPALGLLFRIQQWKLGARDHWDVGAAGDFHQAQGALGFFFHPLIAANSRDAQHVELIRLQKDQDRLHIGGGRTARVLINDDFNFLCLQFAGRCQREDHDQ